jgi:BlaI family transcriptional regulator, penicillinase repressor
MASSRLRKGKGLHELTEGEWVIMKAVWDHEPCAAPTVQEALQEQTRWAYGTVKTIMDRMVEKGFLATEKIRNLILYRSVITQTQAQQGEIMRTLKRAFNGALAPMMQFLVNSEKLSERELDELESLVKAKRKKSS